MTADPAAASAVGRPRVAVLLATHQGEAFLDEQIDSILAQQDVDIRLIVSDDRSTDGTRGIIARRTADPRVVALEPGAFGSPAANFLRLIRDADVAGCDAVAFADQDDVWWPERLARQCEQLATADAVSANVVAVGPDGRQLIDKAQPQRSLDFVFESAGPGCTFVLSPRAFALVRRVVETDPEADRAAIHDWLVYAVVRAAGMRWRIDPDPVLDYRQHGGNFTGANRGLRQAKVRLARLRSGSYRREAAVIARIAARVAAGAERSTLERVALLLERNTPADRVALARGVGSLRRRPRERLALAGLLLAGLW